MPIGLSGQDPVAVRTHARVNIQCTRYHPAPLRYSSTPSPRLVSPGPISYPSILPLPALEHLFFSPTIPLPHTSLVSQINKQSPAPCLGLRRKSRLQSLFPVRTHSTRTGFVLTFSVANNFWGKDDAGVGPMLERLHNAKATSDELKSFYAARAALEDEYARKLLNLSRKPLGSSESGTLRMSLDSVRQEVESMGKAHQSIAQQMKTELEEPLAAFAGGLKERRKIVQGGIEKLLKTKMQQTAAVNKSRDRYEQDCLKIKGFLAQAHMVMGQEERKNKAKLEKTQIQLSSTSSEYEAAVKVLEETTGRWNRDWKAACDVC